MTGEIFGYNFTDVSLLQAALTHPSTKQKANYERLEFLGDRILSAVIAEYLFKNYQNENEGDLAKRLTAFVNGEKIAQIARDFQLNERIILSVGERKLGGMDKNSNLENCLEAIIGAVFLDGGGKEAKDLILKLWDKSLKVQCTPPENPKSKLQEILQEMGLPLPEYQLVGQSGPDHEPIFTMRLQVSGYPDVTIEEKSKKAGQRELANLMLANIEGKK